MVVETDSGVTAHLDLLTVDGGRVTALSDATGLGQEAWAPIRGWLDRLESASQPPQSRVQVAFVTALHLAEATDQGFVFTVDYSMLPADPAKYAGAGNGAVQPNGWIIGRYLFVTVVRAGSGYRIKEVGTSPPWAQ